VMTGVSVGFAEFEDGALSVIRTRIGRRFGNRVFPRQPHRLLHGGGRRRPGQSEPNYVRSGRPSPSGALFVSQVLPVKSDDFTDPFPVGAEFIGIVSSRHPGPRDGGGRDRSSAKTLGPSRGAKRIARRLGAATGTRSLTSKLSPWC
jgi:hypothetical protein